MGVFSTHSYGSEWQSVNEKAKKLLKKCLVDFHPDIKCTGIPHIQYVNLLTPWAESVELKNFKGRIRLIGAGAKINSGPYGPLPHDYVRLSIVSWGDQPEQIGEIVVGEGTELNGTTIVSYASVKIGSNVLFGPGVVILDADGHPSDRRLPDVPVNLKMAPIVIGDNAWIGLNAVILKGVTIGPYAVVGPNSVVHDDVPANTVVAGNPARPIKSYAPHAWFGTYKAPEKKASLNQDELDIVKNFHRLYYDTWHHSRQQTINSSWFGHNAVKCPLDLWIYQEILFENKPDFIVETGTYQGGSAMFLATMLELLGKGKVITIDISQSENRPRHPRIIYLTGSSTDRDLFDRVRGVVEGASVMVILDSDHSKQHVLDELNLYSQIVTPSQYLIVEDTNINGNPVYDDFGPGPFEAVEEFLNDNPSFVVDENRERFMLTMNPGGYLRRTEQNGTP
jgi:cephalosporin hydroxylase